MPTRTAAGWARWPREPRCPDRRFRRRWRRWIRRRWRPAAEAAAPGVVEPAAAEVAEPVPRAAARQARQSTGSGTQGSGQGTSGGSGQTSPGTPGTGPGAAPVSAAFECGNWFERSGGAPQARIRIDHSRRNEEPLPGLPVSLAAPGRTENALTDDAGRVRIEVPPDGLGTASIPVAAAAQALLATLDKPLRLTPIRCYEDTELRSMRVAARHHLRSGGQTPTAHFSVAP